jgi:hypothetical protein
MRIESLIEVGLDFRRPLEALQVAPTRSTLTEEFSQDASGNQLRGTQRGLGTREGGIRQSGQGGATT